MAIVLKLVILTALASWATKSAAVDPNLSIAERLQSNESSMCWDSMMEVRSCIGDIITFFLNGETYLSPDCCIAVRTIVNKCRPMLAVLGFNSDESHILDDYCEGIDGAIPPPQLSTLASISNATKANRMPYDLIP